VCHVIILNVHAPTEDIIDYLKDSFYEEVEHVFYQFCKCHMKVPLGNLNAKVGKEDIFKLTSGNEYFSISLFLYILCPQLLY
jgi:hypothetical protein